MASYFKRYYLDDVKLAQRALLEFHRSLKSGRMIAFTGAMTTESFGYGSWDQLIEVYARIASEVKSGTYNAKAGVKKLLEVDHRQPFGMIDTVLKHRDNPTNRFDARVVLGILEEIVIGHEQIGDRKLPSYSTVDSPFDIVRTPLDALELATAQYFRTPHRLEAMQRAIAASRKELAAQGGPVTKLETNIVQGLLSALGIRRFATLNYDFELERQTMLGDLRKRSPYEELQKLSRSQSTEIFGWENDSGRIRRVLTNGQAVESDILNRERIDRMIEFAVGADDVDRHILHLHGRACQPKSMILSYRDYDRLYRSNDLYKLPFEFAQRIMIGGNPIVFVGLGMSEQEVNEALQDFVSASPYQRMAPTFLLWNYHRPRAMMRESDWDHIQMQRLDRFHRLGVLTIFDVDLEAVSNDKAGIIDLKDSENLIEEGKSKHLQIHNLRWLVSHVAMQAEKIAARENFTAARSWRTMDTKLRIDERVSILWKVADGKSTPIDDARTQQIGRLLSPYFQDDSPCSLACFVGSQGCGQGSLAYRIAMQPEDYALPAHRTLLINGAFSFDTDSLLDGIARFLERHRGGGYLRDEDAEPQRRPRRSRGTYFESLATSTLHLDPLVIIISGMERFFSINGDLLSSELDELINIAASGGTPGVAWLFFGTERVGAYMQSLEIPIVRDPERTLGALSAMVGPEHEEPLPFERFQSIREAFKRAIGEQKVQTLAPAQDRALRDAARRLRGLAAARISGDNMELRQAFYDLYLGAAFDEALGGKRRLAREILRTLAFIGLPAEISVLVHAPRLKAKLKRLKADDRLGRTDARIVADILNKLIDLKLVIAIFGFGQEDNNRSDARRYTLPRTLLSELRYRFSVPLSEAKLSTSFNMSLYIAQPADGFVPEPDIHDELGQLIDRLIGAYREDAAKKGFRVGYPRAALAKVVPIVSAHVRPRFQKNATPRGEDKSQERLENEIDALCSRGHAQRLRAALALVRGYYTTTDLLTLDVGDRLIREDRDGILLEHAERLDCLIDAYGKLALAREALRDSHPGEAFERRYSVDPFYPDEIVWLHNERAVVRLAMGDLYEASASLDRAFDVNTRHVECEDRAHNWRRIRLNQITVDIEAGEIGLALRKIEEILSFSRKRRMLREDQLAIAIALGYRGRARHLQGDVARAVGDYATAIESLGELQESRALAYFLRLRAELGGQGAADDVKTALEIALTTRQMDIAYRLRIMMASQALSHNGDQPLLDHPRRARAQRLLDDAMRYALQTDMHRIRVEASAALAESRRLGGDYEGALRSVSDALMVAARFGMELRKIWLRSLMARIMAARGHPITATNLARETIKIASRRKYQHAIEHAEDTLLSIQRIAAITDVVDASVRRQL